MMCATYSGQAGVVNEAGINIQIIVLSFCDEG